MAKLGVHPAQFQLLDIAMEEGTTILHYKILAKLGEGGMGVVYKAQDTKLDRTVALKFLPPSVAQTDEDRQRFLREAKAAAALNHPNICTIFNVEDHDGQQFISMEFIDGQTLQNLLESRSPDLRTSLEFALQIAEALAKAHSGGIIHRDIKPSNIMINEDGRIKVMDFGLARMKNSEELTQAGTTVGTLDYMSPEQVRSEAVDHRSDIFSFGVVLYEMLTGTKPFRGEHKAATLYSIANEEPTPLSEVLPGIPQTLSDLVKQMLEKNPDNRYSSANELAADLEVCLDELTGTIQYDPEKSKEEPSSAHSTVDEKQGSSGSGSTSITINLPALNTRSGMASLATGILLLILIGYWLVTFFGSSTIPQDNTIAVLPLESFSQNEEDIQFSNGIHVELINRLAGIGDLAVIARSSVMNYHPENRNLQNIGEELGVSSLLEGTVQRSGDQLMVTVQLTDVNNLNTIWSSSFQEHVDNVFEIQSSIAQEVAGELQATLTPDEQQLLEEIPTENPRAYHFFMQGLEYLSQSVILEEVYLNAEKYLLQAIDEDPEFAHAYAHLTLTYSYLYWFHGQDPEHLENIKMTAERAEELAPNLAKTQLALGIYYFWSGVDNEHTLAHFKSALEQFPNQPELYLYTWMTHRKLGNWDQAETHLLKAFELDPRNGNLHRELVWHYWFTRQYDQAEKFANEFIWNEDLFTNLLPIFRCWVLLSQYGSLEGFESWWEELRPSEPAEEVPFAWGEYNYLKRNWQEALHGFENIESDIVWNNEGRYTPKIFFIANTYNAMGDHSKALEYYEELSRNLESLRGSNPDTPRYRATLGRVYARMGKHEQALQEMERVMKMKRVTQNAHLEVFYKFFLAEIYAWTNQYDEAIDILESLLSVPSHAHKGWLRLDPNWDPLRDHSRFQELISDGNEPTRGGS